MSVNSNRGEGDLFYLQHLTMKLRPHTSWYVPAKNVQFSLYQECLANKLDGAGTGAPGAGTWDHVAGTRALDAGTIDNIETL